jgi:penicillin-binding protein 1C
MRVAALGAAAAAAVWFACPPPLKEAARYPAGVILRDRAGHVLRVGLGSGDVDCRPTYHASFDDWIVKAAIASEDKRFRSHCGVDPLSLTRALRQNLSTRRRISGASTITMQTVRLIRPRPRTLFWKGVEAVQALRLERAWSKEDILSQYLNRAPFASNLVGIEAASQGWFGKAPQQLNLGEAALLAGLLQSPTRFRPDRYPAAALKRREYVLARMQAQGMIGEAARADAARQPLALRRAPRPFAEPFFCDWAQSACCLASGDHTTTLDPALQDAVKRLVGRQAAAENVDAAALLLEVRSGAVRALACSGDYFAKPDGQVNTATSPRPAGSTLKPFAYALAIDRGQLTPGRALADVPRRFGSDEPLNFSGDFLGLVSARDALILSLNLPAIEVEEREGQARLYATLRQLGFDALSRPAEHYGLGLVLGAGSVRLTELANAYACLARSGVWRPLRALEAAASRRAPDDSEAAESRRIFSPGACWLIADTLSGDERARDAVGHVADVGLPRFAWKTGTSSGFRDAWTVAWNPDYVVAVWCGHKSGRRGSDTLIGKRVAAPVAWEIIRRLYPAGGAPWYERPPEVEAREVCAASGLTPGPLCERRVSDCAVKGRTTFEVCPVHARDERGRVVERWPAEVAAFLEARSLGAARPLAAAPDRLKIISPAPSAVYRLADGVGAQRVVFKVSGARAGEPLYWLRNDALEGATTGGEPFLWTPQRGEHRFVCADVNGGEAAVTIRVE